MAEAAVPIALGLGSAGAGALGGLFAPEGQEFDSFENLTGPGGTRLGPREQLERAIQGQDAVAKLLSQFATSPTSLPSAFVQQPMSFTNGPGGVGGLPMPIGVTAFDQANPFFSPQGPGGGSRFGPGANPGGTVFTGGPPGGGGDGPGGTDIFNPGPGGPVGPDREGPFGGRGGAGGGGGGDGTIHIGGGATGGAPPLPPPVKPPPGPPPTKTPPKQKPVGGKEGPPEKPKPDPPPVKMPADLTGFLPTDDEVPEGTVDTGETYTFPWEAAPLSMPSGNAGGFDPSIFTADPQRNGSMSEFARLLSQFGIDPTKKVT